MTTALLQTTYFGPVQWYQKLYHSDRVLIEQHDSFQKQTYRNRCLIATANGVQALTVPVEHNGQWSSQRHTPKGRMFNVQCKDLRISDHNQWRRVHWNALLSAYSESPFFEYYADDIRPFYECRYDFLIDFNEAIRQKVCELIDIHPNVEYTQRYILSNNTNKTSEVGDGMIDYRDVINAKHPLPDSDFQPKDYWQVFAHKHGFLPNLSILDLLFCMGPEAIFFL